MRYASILAHMKSRVFLYLLFLCLFLIVSACGVHSGSSNKPLGSGMNPEPGTDGRPAPAPNGHYESMVASDGIVYVGSDNGSLYALNGSDGRVLWQYMANAPVSVVAVVDGAVYAYADNPNSAVAFALNAGSGNVVWRYQVSDFVSKAMVVDKMVYLGTAATANQPVLYALQTSRGALAWRYAAHAITPGLLAVSDGVVYYAEISWIGTAFTENITALGAGDGRALWRLHTQSADGYAYAVSAVVNGAVYISTNTGAVSAARASDGTLLWHSARASIFPGVPSAATPLVADGMVYVTGKQNFASRSQGLDALRASDGKQLWTQAIDGGPGPQVGQPQLVDGVLYYNGSSGVIALRASDGARLWVYSGDTPAGPFFVSDGRVYANSAGGLFVLNASTGALLWKQTIPNHGELASFSTPLLVDGSIVYESSEDGVVQAYNAGGGQLLWRYTIREEAVPTQIVYIAAVTFAASTSFTQVLRTITDLGLQTGLLCVPTWRPQENSQHFSIDHSLLVVATASSAPLWLGRLQASPGVTAVQAVDVVSCPAEVPDNHPPFLTSDQAGAYLRVTFANANYDAALNVVSDMGFRLANPCYEQARANGKQPAWNAMGQQDSYAHTRTLLLATTQYNATTWQSQLQALAGIEQVVVTQADCP